MSCIVKIEEVQETHGVDYYVYCGQSLVRVCPSKAMADEIAASVREDMSNDRMGEFHGRNV